MTAVEARTLRQARGQALFAEHAYVVATYSVLVFSDQAGCPGHSVVCGTCSCPDSRVGTAHQLGLECKHEICSRLALQTTRDRAVRTLREIEAMFATDDGYPGAGFTDDDLHEEWLDSPAVSS